MYTHKGGMMKVKEWKDAEHGTHYYFEQNSGLIVAQVYNLAHTKVWGAKILIEHNVEKYLGNYISCESAKKAIEKYWDVQDRTLIE